MMKKFKAIGTNIIVEKIEIQDDNKLVFMNPIEKEENLICKIISIGDKVDSDLIVTGDIIILKKIFIEQFNIEDKKYLTINYNDIIVKLF